MSVTECEQHFLTFPTYFQYKLLLTYNKMCIDEVSWCIYCVSWILLFSSLSINPFYQTPYRTVSSTDMSYPLPQSKRDWSEFYNNNGFVHALCVSSQAKQTGCILMLNATNLSFYTLCSYTHHCTHSLLVKCLMSISIVSY